MEQRSYPYSQKRNNSYYNGNISRNQIKSNNTVINLVNIIYDNEFVSLINNLSSSLKDCFKLINNSLKNIKDISSSLGNQIVYSKCLINDYIMVNKKNKNDKLIQVKDRLDFIDNNKNLLESNISFMNVNITSFLEHAKTLFKRMKISRNNKLNNIQNNNNILKNDIKFNNYFSNNNYNSNDNYHSKETKNKRNYSSYDNMRYKAKSQNTFQNYNSLSFKKNKSFKNISDNLLINSSDDVNNNNIENKNDCSERQKTISFNLRQFMFNKNKNKINNLLENISLNKENKINKNNNLLFNYCSLVNNSKAKNNRKKVNKGNIKSLKNINSFKNDNRINNFFNNNIYENRNDNNLNNNKKKINFNYNSNSSINKMINKDVDNSDSLKIAENNNNKQKNIDAILANKIIEYFTLLKSNEKNKIKIDKIQKYLINISLNIINKKENHINNLKQNFLKNAKIPENIMRNNYSNQMRINNSVGNDKKENSENIINILNKELNKKNEYIRKIKNVMENRCNKNGIVKAQNFEIIQKRKILLIIKKEINLNYLSDMNNYKTIEELKKQIIELKHNYNSENNNKNYKYKYELVIEEINTKKNEINELNNKIDELTKTNNSLLNKLDTIELSKKNLEQEKTNLLLKIKKLEDFSENKKIIITNSDEEPIEDFSDIIEEQSSENEKEKNLVQENNKLQEKINILQSELNKKILNENDKNRKLSRNAGNNEYENCVDFDPINRIKKEKNNSNNNISELKMKEDLIEKLQAKINELEKNNNKNIFFSKKDDYIVLSEKNYKTLKWFLLTKKININNLNYENTFWTNKENVDKELIKNLNLEISNSDEEKMIMNYLKKLEEKENIISKLQLKIKNMEKNMGLNMSNKNMRSKSSNTKNILKNNNEEEEYYEDSDFD